MTEKGISGGVAIVRALENEGVEYIFGISGGSVIPIYDALITTQTKIKLVLTRHEQGAAHMADGYARATGKPGVVLVTSGPGATNILTGPFHCADGFGADDCSDWAVYSADAGERCLSGGRYL